MTRGSYPGGSTIVNTGLGYADTGNRITDPAKGSQEAEADAVGAALPDGDPSVQPRGDQPSSAASALRG